MCPTSGDAEAGGGSSAAVPGAGRVASLAAVVVDEGAERSRRTPFGGWWGASPTAQSQRTACSRGLPSGAAAGIRVGVPKADRWHPVDAFGW
jgi:hypothetical protein